MAELLKHRYTTEFLNLLCDKVQEFYCDFDRENFLLAILDKNWEAKELKERMGHIAVCLHEFLPEKFSKAIEILKPVSEHFSGFEPMFFPDFVARFGLEEYEESIEALAHFTRYSSSEFAVRPFIVKYPKKMMRQMLTWASSDNHHVRRLASEGCRPRLPWAMALPDFKKDPSPILPILKKLKNDESEYVRRSVANNLNDISKDHSEIVIDIASTWLGKTENTDRLVKHACRTLLKSGNVQTLSLFDFALPTGVKVMKFKADKTVKMGDSINFSFDLVADKSLGKLRIEFAIEFARSSKKSSKRPNKSRSRKIFKISESVSEGDKKSVTKKFSFSPISTRRYYAGKHILSIVVNGVELSKKSFVLVV